MFIGEMIGREGQARAQRKSVGDVDRALMTLLERDQEGMKAVMLARAASDAKVKALDNVDSQGAVSRDAERFLRSGKNTHTAHVGKQFGFDSTRNLDQQKKSENSALLKVGS